SVYDHARDRLTEIEEKRKRGEEHEEGDDHVFSCISDMDKAALDISHYADNRSDHGLDVDLAADGARRSPKIDQTVHEIMTSLKGNQGKQIVFCDAVTMHEPLREALIAAGYPEDQIAIINAKTMPHASDRLRLSTAYNGGSISLVIGNTATMGEGMNFQKGTTDIHHLNLPWTPKDIEQRDGRGVRQGNDLDAVNVHYYLAEGSLDAYRQDALRRKEGAFEELWNGTADSATSIEAAMEEDKAAMISILSSDSPEEVARKLEQQKQARREKERMDGAKASFRQFESLQNKQKLYHALTESERLGEKGRGMLADIERTKKRLQANPYFEHKALLETGPVYIHKDRKTNTQAILKVGDHIKNQEEHRGKILKVTSIDLNKKEVKAIEVARTGYDPVAWNPGLEETLPLKDFVGSGKELADKQSKVKGRGWDKNRAMERFLTTVEYNDEIHRDRILERPSYKGIRTLDPQWTDENRELVEQAIRDSGGYSEKFAWHDDFEGYKLTTKGQIPDDATIILPSDGQHRDQVLQAFAKADLERDYSAKADLNKISQELFGHDLNRKNASRDRVLEFQNELIAARESGPSEGETRLNRAGHLEILRGGRWVLANPEDYTPVATKQMASDVVDQSIPKALWRDEIKASVAKAIFRASRGDTSLMDALPHVVADRLKYDSSVPENDKPKAAEIIAQQAMARADGKPAEPQVLSAMDRLTEVLVSDAALRPIVENNPRDKAALVIAEEMKNTAVKLHEQDQISVEELDIALRIADSPRADVIASDIYDQIKEQSKGQSVDSKEAAEPAPPLPPVDNPVEPLPEHPDPIGSITNALSILYGQDPDGASEINGRGFNKLHTPYRYAGGQRYVNNEFVASLVEKLDADSPLTDNQLKAALKVVFTYNKRLGKDHGVALPTLEQLEAALSDRPPAPQKAFEEMSQREIAQGIISALEQAVEHHDFDANLYERRGTRIYLNPKGERRGGPGFIEVHEDGTFANNTSLEDSHAVFQVASDNSLGMKQQERSQLSGNPSKEDFANYLAQELNAHPDIDLKAAPWVKGNNARVYINTPGARSGPSGRPEYIDVTTSGISDKTSLPSTHVMLQEAQKIASQVIADHGFLRKSITYVLGDSSFRFNGRSLVKLCH
ncbi:MAG: helicase-related protein, partial [Cyanobacteria bacterium P01_A01_bin.17]